MAKAFRAAASFFLLSAMFFRLFFLSLLQRSLWGVLVVFTTVLSACLCFIAGVVCLVLSYQPFPASFTMYEAFYRFIIKRNRLYIGRKTLKKFHACCKNPRKAQEELLHQIIANNKHTVYGYQFQLSEIHCLEDLRRKHPVTGYDRYEAFVDRIARGQRDVLTTEKITRLILTSGTTGNGKRIPQDWYNIEENIFLLEAIQHEVFPDLHPMQSKFRIHCNGQIRKTDGIPVAPALAIESYMFKQMVIYSSPSESFLIDSIQESNYIHLLFALRDRTIGSIFASFSSLFVETMKYFEENWKSMVEDLKGGTLNSDLQLNPQIRVSLSKKLGSGDPQRAAEVKRECEKGFEGILKRLWPNMKFISVIDNVNLQGAMKKSFARGLEIYSPWYVSSETLMGVNLWPFEDGEEEYALHLSENIFEFIPEDEMDKENPRTFFVDEVEVGQNYELIFTQKYGLYRYRFGDIVKVSGFYKSCPKVKFLYRKATLLNLVGEKVDQTVVSDSLKDALSQWTPDVGLSHYCVAENTLLDEYKETEHESGGTNMFYIFFLELESTNGRDLPEDLQTKTLAQEIDKGIFKRHSFYRNFRDTSQISESKVYLVKNGTFQKLREYILTNTSASASQFKMPLKLRTKAMAEIVLENIRD